METNILVTGSKGQLGQELVRESEKYNYRFHFHDIDTLDLSDTNELVEFFQQNKIDLLINSAGYTAVDQAEEDEKTANIVNHIGVRDLSLLAREHKTRMIHISTDYVFDGKNHKPYTEDDAPAPDSVYGFTKLKGEFDVLNHEESMIIRTSWLYSEYGNNFVKTMIKLGKEKKELDVITDQVGSPTYARDLARALLQIVKQTIEKPTDFKKGIYHYSNEGVCSWYDFAIAIMEIADIPCIINPIETKDYPLPAPRPHYSVLNKTKIKNTFGIKIPYWKSSLAECIKALNHN
jgi:dTDP-4-dehydrorhamnose reductase